MNENTAIRIVAPKAMIDCALQGQDTIAIDEEMDHLRSPIPGGFPIRRGRSADMATEKEKAAVRLRACRVPCPGAERDVRNLRCMLNL